MLASVNDLVKALGEREIIELSQADEAEANSVDTDRIQSGLDDAQAFLEDKGMPIAHRLFKRYQIIATRWFLDLHERRDDVQRDFDWLNDQLEAQSEMGSIRRGSPRFAVDPRRMPQIRSQGYRAVRQCNPD